MRARSSTGDSTDQLGQQRREGFGAVGGVWCSSSGMKLSAVTARPPTCVGPASGAGHGNQPEPGPPNRYAARYPLIKRPSFH